MNCTWTDYTDEQIFQRVFPLARGNYQRELLLGRRRWSGADLQGKAREFASKYAASRKHLIARIRGFGYKAEFIKQMHGRKVLVISE